MKTKAAGFTLVEMIVVIVIIGLAAVPIAEWQRRSVEQTFEAAAAQHALSVAEAASNWAKDNIGEVTTNTSVGSGAAYPLTVATLKLDGYLPPSFEDVSPLGQTYLVRFRQPTAGTVSGLMIAAPAAGSVVEDLSLRRIARQMGAPGGYVEASRPSGTPASQVDGALGGWTVDAALWGWTSVPAGSLAYSLFFSQAESTGDFVYRRTVPGRPELNQMNAPLDMAGNNISNIGTLQASAIQGAVTLQPTAASPLTPCSTNGQLASGGPTGLMLCQSLVWRAVALQ